MDTVTKAFEVINKAIVSTPSVETIVVNLFVRNNFYPKRNCYELLVVDANLKCGTINPSIDIKELIKNAENGLGQNSLLLEDDETDQYFSKFEVLREKIYNEDAYARELANKHPRILFKDLAHKLFKNVDGIILSIYNTPYGVGLTGTTVENDYGTLSIIAEAGGNETGTDFNAVFLKHPKLTTD